jgi:hypothetical protein
MLVMPERAEVDRQHFKPESTDVSRPTRS